MANTAIVAKKFGGFEFNKATKFTAFNPAEADKRIKEIKARGRSLKTYIHETAVGILMHAAKTGDWSKLTDLMGAIRVAMGKNMLVAYQSWVISNSPLAFDKDKENQLGDASVVGNFWKDKAKGNEYRIEQAQAMPFWDAYEPAPSPKGPVDFYAVVQNAISNLLTAMKEGRLKNGTEHVEALVKFAHSEGIYKTEEELAMEKEEDKRKKADAKAEQKLRDKEAGKLTKKEAAEKQKDDAKAAEELGLNDPETEVVEVKAEESKAKTTKDKKGTGQAISTGEAREESKAEDKPSRRRPAKSRAPAKAA